MSQYFRNGTRTMVAAEGNVNKPSPTLAPGFYSIAYDMKLGYFLEDAPTLELPAKVYGDPSETADRFLKTFADRAHTTGVLLSGLKGAGKSLLLKVTCINAVAAGIPVITVNAPFCGDAFSDFIQSIDQPCIIVLDEFEKLYDNEITPGGQQSFLTLMDGIKSGKKMYLLTVNEEDALDTNLINRPGRIFYHLTFKGLSPLFIQEYLRDSLSEDNQKHVDEIILMTRQTTFSFDMLSSLVEEMNRYGEPPAEAVRMLNIVDRDPVMCDVTVLHAETGAKISMDDIKQGTYRSTFGKKFTLQLWRDNYEGRIHGTAPIPAHGAQDPDTVEHPISTPLGDFIVVVSKDDYRPRGKFRMFDADDDYGYRPRKAPNPRAMGLNLGDFPTEEVAAAPRRSRSTTLR